VLAEGSTHADEALLTGESTPVPKASGDALVGGSVNLGAPVTMQVQRVGADTRHEAIVALMRDAMSQRPSMARVADRWAGPFLWGVLALAALAASVWSVIDPSRAVWVAVSVLIVTCPCALSLAVPAVLVAAAGGLARRGVLVQRLDSLECMAQLDRLFIDKTGTLTTQALQLQQSRIVTPNDAMLSRDGAVAVAASLAAWSRHPLSQALAAAAVQAPQWAWTQVEELAGRGVQGRDSRGRVWRLGSHAWAGAGAPAANSPPPVPDAATSVWLCADDGGLACFGFDEVLREGATEAMRRLREQGYQLSLLSGDSPARATQLARQLQLHAAIGGATPQDKLGEVARAQARGERVAMVGDGVNDAPVLARADVSLAMGQGALVARAQADAVLVGNRPMDIVHTLAVSRRAMRIVRQNLVWALLYNLACVPLALLGFLPPWAAGLGMASSSTLVILNALRAAR
ncbi:MAG: heavy metal translocating P-type ATPase, partial [Rubrivivax sp.]